MKTYLVISDLHIPYACPKYMNLILKILKAQTFQGIVQLGDALDWFQLSTYDKDPARKNTVKDDVDEWSAILTKWSSLLPRNAEIHLICGNHENRLARYVARHAKELHELVRPLPCLLRLKERNDTGHVKFKWHPYSKWNSCKIGDCVLFHGFYFSQHTAMTNLKKYRVSNISGHTHRAQYVSDGEFYACSLGHGSNEKLTAHQPTPTEWTQALGVLTVDDFGKTSLEIVIVKEGKGVWRGKVYQG